MNSDGKIKGNVDPNLENKSRPNIFHNSEDLQERALGNTYFMPPREGYLHNSAEENHGTVFLEPTSVDGASFTKLLNSSGTSSVSIRPHQVDAVHPFFNGYRSVKFDKSTSTDNQVFYCRQCELSIELCHEAIKQHFETTQHTPIEVNCIYCNTAVYEYFYNENVCYYHRCPTERHQIVRTATENSSDKSHRPSSIKSPNDQDSVKPETNEPTDKSGCETFSKTL